MRTPALSVFVLLALVSAPRSMEQRPDFSGTWTLPHDAPPGPGGKRAPAPGFATEINIRQDANAITIAKIIGGQTVHVVHPLDGSESRARTPGRLCEGDSQTVWTATWEDDAILTTLVSVIPPGEAPPSKPGIRTVFRLTAPDTMSIELTLRTAGGGEPRTVTTTYKRTGPASDVPPAPGAPAVPARISQLEWLGGIWIGSGGTTTFEERWTPPAGGSMLSVARSIRTGFMNSFEFLCITERNGTLVYQAMPNGRQPATDFTLTRLEGTSARFENPAHDFPKAIAYTLSADGTLEAVISGTEKQKPQTFRFKKQ